MAKYQFDKFILDKTEEKAAFDLVLEKTEAAAAEQKAILDKALIDMSEMQVGHNPHNWVRCSPHVLRAMGGIHGGRQDLHSCPPQ